MLKNSDPGSDAYFSSPDPLCVLLSGLFPSRWSPPFFIQANNWSLISNLREGLFKERSLFSSDIENQEVKNFGKIVASLLRFQKILFALEAALRSRETVTTQWTAPSPGELGTRQNYTGQTLIRKTPPPWDFWLSRCIVFYLYIYRKTFFNLIRLLFDF